MVEIVARGTTPVLPGEAYRGARSRLLRLLRELGLPETLALQTASRFSALYRSLPAGSSLGIEVGEAPFHLELRLRLRPLPGASVDPSPLGACFTVIENADPAPGEVVLCRRLPVTGRLAVQRCRTILEERTAEELAHDVSDATVRLRDTRNVLVGVQQELTIAADIQRQMLVSERELNRLTPGLDVAALMIPSKGVGGDLYDCIPIGDSRYLLCIGDVSGKGVPAALMMSTCLTLLRAYAEILESPATIMARINQRMSHGNDNCGFTTLLIGILDALNGQFRYCNAGHNPALVLRQNGDVEALRPVHGVAVGIQEGLVYGEDSLTLAEGETLLAYTDGANETFNPQHERFGLERMIRFFQGTSTASTPRLMRRFIRQLRDFGGDEPQHDDITLLAVRRLPWKHPNPEAELHISIGNQVSELAVIRDAVTPWCQQHHVPPTSRRRLQVVLDELMGNAIRHGLVGMGREAQLTLDLGRKGHQLRILLQDNGPPFNLLEVPSPDFDTDLEARPIGGLGLHLVRQMVTSTRYRRQDGSNTIELLMDLTQAPVPSPRGSGPD